MTPHDALITKLVAADCARTAGGEPLSRPFLLSVVDFAAGYARLEKLLFGSPRVVYSSSSLEIDLSLAGDPLAQGEKLAEAERARFDLPAGPILELGYLIEDQGIKIIPRAFPAGSRACGGFFFDGVLGPCILVDARSSSVERDYVLAHQYGHFLADYDPYITTLCGRPEPYMLENARESRAHEFALAFLMPRADFELYRSAMGLKADVPLPIELARQLQVYFDVDLEMIFWRLLSLGWVDAERLATLLKQNEGLLAELRGAAEDPDPGRVIPGRFIHLVASAFGRKLIDLDGAAEFLGASLVDTKGILDQFHYEYESGRAPSRGKPPIPGPGSSRTGSTPSQN